MQEIVIDVKKRPPLTGVLPRQLIYMLKVYLTGIVGFTSFRLLLLLQEFHQLHYFPTPVGTLITLKAFLMGLRFDTVVSGYILTLPFILLTVDAFRRPESVFLKKTAYYLINAGYIFGFFVCAADLPFFHHFYTRMSSSAFISADSGGSDMLSAMIFQEWRFYWVLLPFTVISWLFLRLHKRMFQVLFRREELPVFVMLRSYVFFALLLVLGIWGRLSFQSNLDAGAAYFSDYALPNMLGLNPVYTFFRSYVEELNHSGEEVHFLGDGEAVRNVQEYLKVSAAQDFQSPIAREIKFVNDSGRKPNVVLVLMESMSARKMGRYGNPHHLTPFLDSLANLGYTFDSVFTSGIHTFAGIYTTLFGFPVIKRQHPLMTISPHSGIAATLRKHGYSTIYFTTHDKEFDNTGPFLLQNGFDRVISKDDYPKEKIISALGVPDDYLFSHAIGVLNDFHQQNKPFFAAIMTGSDHSPYVIPIYFKPRHREVTLGIVEYVDWSLRQFMTKAAKQPWFENTLFIFIADHGAALDKRYDMSLSYLHTPLIFYGPSILGEPRQFSKLGSQADVFPTLMGILKLSYINNTFGIDLLQEDRPFAWAFADDKFAVLNTEYMFVWRDNGITSLYHYRSEDVSDYSALKPELRNAMKIYGESTFQAAQWLRKNGKTGMF